MSIGRRSWLRVVLPLLAAVIVVAAFLIVSRAPVARLQHVLVTTQALAAGTVLTAADVSEATTPTLAVGDLTAVQNAIGQTLTVPLAAGEHIRQEDLVPPLSAALTQELPVGERAVTVSLTAVAAVGFQLVPGNRVDVIATFGASSGPKNAPLSDLVLSNVLILRVAAPATGATNGLITLELTPTQVATLELSQQLGSITLALRPARDHVPASALQEVTVLP